MIVIRVPNNCDSGAQTMKILPTRRGENAIDWVNLRRLYVEREGLKLGRPQVKRVDRILGSEVIATSLPRAGIQVL